MQLSHPCDHYIYCGDFVSGSCVHDVTTKENCVSQWRARDSYDPVLPLSDVSLLSHRHSLFQHVFVGSWWWQKLYRMGDLVLHKTDESPLLHRISILWLHAFHIPGADFVDLGHFEIENWCISFHSLDIWTSSDLLQACCSNHVGFYSTNFYELTSFFILCPFILMSLYCFETTLNLLENATTNKI